MRDIDTFCEIIIVVLVNSPGMREGSGVEGCIQSKFFITSCSEYLSQMSLTHNRTYWIIYHGVKKSLKSFYQHDKDLITEDLYEPSISAKIGMHMFHEFSWLEDWGYHVDCEYDKKGGERKLAPPGSKHGTMRPDIVIHVRAKNVDDSTKGNLLFCEVKKDKCSEEDKMKINHALSEEYGYCVGLSICNLKEDGCQLIWFRKDSEQGNVISEEPFPNNPEC